MFNFPLAPVQASSMASRYDMLYWITTALTVIFTVIVLALLVFFTVRYRRGTKADRSNPKNEHLLLEISWSALPGLIGIVVFFGGAKLFIDVRTPPKDFMDVYVIGKQWMWQIQHADGVRENDQLHLPVGKAVRCTMISQDVIHAFYIPEFRVQYHVVPGRYTQMFFTPNKIGTYHIYCGQYCGTQHSEMVGTVTVMSQNDFGKWLHNGGEQKSFQTPEEMGAELFNKRLLCNNCHTDRDTERGPTLMGIAGKSRKFTDGTSAVADIAYIRESILRPYDHLTAGYDKTMPEYMGQLSEEQILNLMAYIGSLSPSATTTGTSPQMGMQQNKKYTPPPTMAVGALGAKQTTPPLGPTSKNLAVGAEAGKGDNR